ncbi:unnamed protein product [Vitrella brassicaformis CCMP3155]|uniref:Uncharacterized protein n=2 Tax=Vitrella brassicaformis TaxID=1169539 RepID=A0A0G4GWC4_VITBC|nr:unnamed protein product [Vitrella brassicaformis CCMP3155]|mmetsp:Transcript_24501/g.60533  ORF Transcript_24501/g.60533 Transcript_24501/m.60533 type:complete len:611 (+) Transcript_24501:100-1932(+)|eukprot:CEM35279.1 unnamed protein product [Vitrella brassicaformis CCMP3155]
MSANSPVIPSTEPSPAEGVVAPNDPLVKECEALLQKISSNIGFATAEDLQSLKQKMAQLAERYGEKGLDHLHAYAAALNSMTSQWMYLHAMRVNEGFGISQHGLVQGVGLMNREEALANRVAETMKKAFWDNTQWYLDQSPPQYDIVLQHLNELRNTMARYIPEKRREAFLESLDLDLVKKQVETKTFDPSALQSVIGFLVTSLHDLESPFRHEQTVKWFTEMQQKLAGLGEQDAAAFLQGFHLAIIESLKYLFSRLDILESEIQQWRMSQINGIQRQKMEQQHFAKMLDRGEIGLARTNSFLFTDAPALTLPRSPSPPSAAPPSQAEIAAALPPVYPVFVQRMAELIASDKPLQMGDCPEPLRLDLSRLHGVQDGLQRAAVLALVAVLATPLFPSQVADKGLVEQVYKAVEASLQEPHISITSLSEVLVLCIDRVIIENARQQQTQTAIPEDTQSAATPSPTLLADEQKESLKEKLRKCLASDSAVLQVLLKRVFGAFQTAVEGALTARTTPGSRPPSRPASRPPSRPMSARGGSRPDEEAAFPLSSTAMGDSPWELKFSVDAINRTTVQLLSVLEGHWQVYGLVYKKLWFDHYVSAHTSPAESATAQE